MSFNETLNLKASEKLLRTTIMIIISLTNFHKGLTTYVEMDYIHDNEKIFSSVKSKSFLSDNSYGNEPISSILSTSKFTIESQSQQQYRSHRTDKNNINDEYSTNKIRRPSFESQTIAVSSHTNKSKRLSSNHVTHKVIDLIHQDDRPNSYANNTIETIDAPAHTTPMYFGTDNSTVVTTQSGATAHISCIVHHIGECVVSWIRKSDYHLLTVGLTAYSSDERFSATHLKHSEDWTLQIKFVQERDSGIYECQVSTHPPTSIFFNLSVVVARAEISGPNIRYLTPGSTLRLQCHVIQNTENSEFIFWYHDNRMINYDADRGINVSTEPDFLSSELIISRTRREHSGNYTCVASNTQPASVLVHIFKGDNPAAMYHGHVGSSQKSYQMHTFYTALIAILLRCCTLFV